MESPIQEKARVIETHAEQYEEAVAHGAMSARFSSETRAYLQGLRDAARLIRGERVDLPGHE